MASAIASQNDMYVRRPVIRYIVDDNGAVSAKLSAARKKLSK